MNILVIGNGFDLAHGFETKYSDFLDFLEFVEDIKTHIEDTKTIGKFYIKNYEEIFIKNYENDENAINRILSYTKNNFWIEHFKKRKNIIGERWIDFEKEISDVLNKIVFADKMDNIFYSILNYVVDMLKNDIAHDTLKCDTKNLHLLKIVADLPPDEYTKIKEIIENINKATDGNENSISKDTYNIILKYIITVLEDDLIKLIRVFEMYICLVINKQEIKEISEDIISIRSLEKVISFNYTDTCLRILDYISKNKNTFIQYNDTLNANNYKILECKDILYIHGSANEEKMNSPLEIEENKDDMILGVYENLKDEKNIVDDFIFFKKYYQRILKNTDGNNESEEDLDNRVPEENKKFTYKRCLENIKGSFVYIFGHSLDISDNDILEKLIVKSYRTVIYYHNIETNKIQIINLIKMLGQKKLVDYRNSGKIIFRKQKENIKIENDDDKYN